MQPRAFVVMPYDVKDVGARDAAAGTSTNVDFNAVYTKLIKPAATGAGCHAFRADEETSAGDIRIDLFFELVTADLVIADVSIPSANVFYELGVRHGVSPRGAILLHADWTPLPFDSAPDRTFKYDGRLFVQDGTPATANDEAIAHEVKRLQGVLKDAIAAEGRTTASPVYSHLPGLKPVDWRNLETTRARYLDGVGDDWSARVRIAKRNGKPEDILTLAEAAPTRFHHERILFEAAEALLLLQRFDAAHAVLTELLRDYPGHFNARSQLGLALGRLKRLDEAAEHTRALTKDFHGDPEAQGILGRACKDMWRLRWESAESLEERRRLAMLHSAYVRDALDSYQRAHELHPDSFYNGINLLTLTRLLAHVEPAKSPAATATSRFNDMATVVDFVARAALQRAIRSGSSDDIIWARGTLAELAIARGQGAIALEHYRLVAYARDVAYFHIESMIGQLTLYKRLDCEPEAVDAAMALLEARKIDLSPPPRYEKVCVAAGPAAAGHAADPRELDPADIDATRARIEARLAAWKIDERSLAICGGARGAELLFAEVAAQRGAAVRLLIPLPESEFIGRKLRTRDDGWVERFLALRQRGGRQVTIRSQPEFLGPPPQGMRPEERNERWIVNTARVDSTLDSLHTLLFGAFGSDAASSDPASLASRLGALGGRLAVEP